MTGGAALTATLIAIHDLPISTTSTSGASVALLSSGAIRATAGTRRGVPSTSTGLARRPTVTRGILTSGTVRADGETLGRARLPEPTRRAPPPASRPIVPTTGAVVADVSGERVMAAARMRLLPDRTGRTADAHTAGENGLLPIPTAGAVVLARTSGIPTLATCCAVTRGSAGVPAIGLAGDARLANALPLLVLVRTTSATLALRVIVRRPLATGTLGTAGAGAVGLQTSAALRAHLGDSSRVLDLEKRECLKSLLVRRLPARRT